MKFSLILLALNSPYSVGFTTRSSIGFQMSQRLSRHSNKGLQMTIDSEAQERLLQKLLENPTAVDGQTFSPAKAFDAVITSNGINLDIANNPTFTSIKSAFKRLASNADVEAVITIIASKLGADNLPPETISTIASSTEAILTTAFFAIAINAITSKQAELEAMSLLPPTEYVADEIAAYYNGKPSILIRRLIYTSSKIAALVSKLLIDKALNRDDDIDIQTERAVELKNIITNFGPAFIKVAQGLSVRPDLLPQVYLAELQKLQDQVAPFSPEEAYSILIEELEESELNGVGNYVDPNDIFVDAEQAFAVPIAAASLGQVYRATLRPEYDVGQIGSAKNLDGSISSVGSFRSGTGTEVAVKLQRPDVLKSVTLDLYVIRLLLTGVMNLFPQYSSQCSNTIDIIDAWGPRFLDELDYEKESYNTARFGQDVANSDTLANVIVVPRVWESFTTRHLLVTEWVEGVKLSTLAGMAAKATTATEAANAAAAGVAAGSLSATDTVPLTNAAAGTAEGEIELQQLTNMGAFEAGDTGEFIASRIKSYILPALLNSYLVQLLETGFLHADPHPGNFLLLEDGRVCVLDYGLMTEVTEDRRVAFIEYISHLSSKQYSETLGDLVRLGFIDEDIMKNERYAAIVGPLLANVLEQLSQGGGVKALERAQDNRDSAKEEAAREGKVDVAQVGQEIQDLAKKYPLTIPPYFGLIVRAFSALEGLGLSVDPNYSIVNECFPYLARRFLTDNSPRVRAALLNFLYGSEGATGDLGRAFQEDGVEQVDFGVIGRGSRLSVTRVDELVSGYKNFVTIMAEREGDEFDPATTDSSAPAASASSSVLGSSSLAFQRAELVQSDAARDSAKELLLLLLSDRALHIQDIVIEEVVALLDATTREVVHRTIQQIAGFARGNGRNQGQGQGQPALTAPFGAFSGPAAANSLPRLPSFFPPPPPLGMLFPFAPVLSQVVSRAEALSELTDEDQKTLSTAKKISALVIERAAAEAVLDQNMGMGSTSGAGGGNDPASMFYHTLRRSVHERALMVVQAEEEIAAAAAMDPEDIYPGQRKSPAAVAASSPTAITTVALALAIAALPEEPPSPRDLINSLGGSGGGVGGRGRPASPQEFVASIRSLRDSISPTLATAQEAGPGVMNFLQRLGQALQKRALARLAYDLENGGVRR